MRLGTYVALEVCALALATVSFGTALGRAGRFLLAETRGAAARRRAFLSLGTWGELPAPSAPNLSDAGERTFLGMADELLLDRLRTAPITRIKFNHGGTSISLRLEFADGSRAAFKPEQTNPQSVPRKEVAAYRLDRLLALGHVAPAAPRRLSRAEITEKLVEESRGELPRILGETIFDSDGETTGEAQYWIPVIKDTLLEKQTPKWTGWLQSGGAEPEPEERALAAQLSTLIVFDLLTNNSDRFSGGNLVASPDLQFLYYLDNTFGFQLEPGGHVRCRQALARVERFSRSLYQALRRLDHAAIVRELAKEPDPPYAILTSDEIDALLARRNVALATIDDLIARFGRERVLVFP